MREYVKAYQRFINLMLATENLSDPLFVSPIERRILYILSTYWSSGKSITVSESLIRVNEVSAATAFKYIKKLKEKGYIRLSLDKNDNRIKYVLPTALTDKFFGEMGKHLIEAASIKSTV